VTYDHEDWFSRHIPNWTTWFAELAGKRHIIGVEVGSFEGRSARWLLEHVLTGVESRLYCIDPYSRAGMEDAGTGGAAPQAYKRFDENVLSVFQNVTLIRGTSRNVLRHWDRGTCDFIYIDGSHLARDVLVDCVLAWPVLSVGGLMILDDYTWRAGPEGTLPWVAIDAFAKVMAPYLMVVHCGDQVCLRKLA
jgi:predicted O-methyltransferase YrrM